MHGEWARDAVLTVDRRNDAVTEDLLTDDKVVLVDGNDRPRGAASKLAAHEAPGLLHRALSVVLWAPEGRVVVQRRALGKYHFPGLWSNSCCSHPRPGESITETARRRVAEELGAVPFGLTCVGRFAYSAHDDATGLVEREVDHVVVGRIEGDLDPNPDEIADLKLIDLEALVTWFASESQSFSPWFCEVMRHATPEHGLFLPRPAAGEQSSTTLGKTPPST